MINFAQPQYLLLIFLIPLFFVCYAIVCRLRKRRIRKFGDEALVSGLMPSASRAKGWVRLVLFSIAFFFFSIGLSRPQIGAKLKEHKTKGAEIMIVLDVSNSMLAEDYSPNRIDCLCRKFVCPAADNGRLCLGEDVPQFHIDRIRAGAGYGNR